MSNKPLTARCTLPTSSLLSGKPFLRISVASFKTMLLFVPSYTATGSAQREKCSSANEGYSAAIQSYEKFHQSAHTKYSREVSLTRFSSYHLFLFKNTLSYELMTAIRSLLHSRNYSTVPYLESPSKKKIDVGLNLVLCGKLPSTHFCP